VKQEKGGYWRHPEDFYIRSKYKGAVWQLVILAELGANGDNTQVEKACKFILESSQDRQSGGFAYVGSREKGNKSQLAREKSP